MVKLVLNMSASEKRNRLADLLQQVIDGKVLPDAALKVAEAWTDMPWNDREVNVAWHTLAHFQIDEDIRKKDPEYDAGLKRQLLLHIAKLRSNPG
jgi:hypothetical protein